MSPLEQPLRIPRKAVHAWSRISVREQRALKGLALFIILTVTGPMLIHPQYQAFQHAEKQLKEEKQLYQQVQQLIANQATGTSLPVITAENLASTLTQTSRSAGLELEEMDNNTLGQVSLSLEGSFEELLLWIDQLEQRHVIVSSFSIDVSKNSNAKARLQLSVH